MILFVSRNLWEKQEIRLQTCLGILPRSLSTTSPAVPGWSGSWYSRAGSLWCTCLASQQSDAITLPCTSKMGRWRIIRKPAVMVAMVWLEFTLRFAVEVTGDMLLCKVQCGGNAAPLENVSGDLCNNRLKFKAYPVTDLQCTPRREASMGRQHVQCVGVGLQLWTQGKRFHGHLFRSSAWAVFEPATLKGLAWSQ